MMDEQTVMDEQTMGYADIIRRGHEEEEPAATPWNFDLRENDACIKLCEERGWGWCYYWINLSVMDKGKQYTIEIFAEDGSIDMFYHGNTFAEAILAALEGEKE